MKVSLQLPTGTSLFYDVDQECTLVHLQKLIHDSEGIPAEMQNFFTRTSINSTNWQKEKLTDMFPEGFDGEELKLQMVLGPLPGAGVELDCCFCGCGILSEGKCFVHLCSIGCGCVDQYHKFQCICCCFRGACSLL